MTLLLKIISLLIPGYDIPFTWTKFKRILVVDLNYLGDMVQSSVVYRDLHERFQEAKIEALVLQEMVVPLSINPYVDKIHTVASMEVKEGIRKALQLRREKYDLVIQLNTSLKTNLLLRIIGKRYRLGYDYKHRGCFLNIRVPISHRTNRVGSRVEEILRLTNYAFGNRASSREMIFPFRSIDRIELRYRLREEYGVTKGDILVGMHSVCRTTKDKRQWNRFVELGMYLLDNPRVRLVLTGGPEDVESVTRLENWILGRVRPINLAGKISLKELPALLSDLAVFVTINTGPMHIAIANKVPTFAIIGGSPASVVFPQGDSRYQYIEDPAFSYEQDWVDRTFVPCINYITSHEVSERVKLMIDTHTNRAVNW